MSKIEWTEKTWNPIVGCAKVSAGCKNCYAIRMAWRLQHIGHSASKYNGTVEKTAGGQLNWTGKVNIIEKEFVKPFTWKKPSMIFVNSESDLFHESIPFKTIRALFGVMSVCNWHTFQILTKRPQRMVEFFKWFEKSDPDWQNDPAHEAYDLCVAYGIETGCGSAFETDAWPLKNVWLGVSVENQQAADERIPLLLQVPAAVRFLSCEPLLGPLRLDQLYRVEDNMTWVDNCLTGFKSHGAGGWYGNKIDWVIVGGESGKDARPMHPEWARSLRDQCQKAGIAFFFKQWGAWAPGNFFTSDPGQIWMGNDGGIDEQQPRQMMCYGRQVVAMKKVSKDKASRLLDNVEWNEFPGQNPVPADDPDLYTGGFDY